MIQPKDVHSTLRKYMIVDGFDLVLDLEKSSGSRVYDAKTQQYLLDGFSFFASAPLGCNHPKLTTPEFIQKLGKVAVNKPTNSDLYTVEMADFVHTFGTVAMPSSFQHLFFISGGALAIENGLKTAFDWKIRKNFQQGETKELGNQVIHFKEAFHGRTGYTLSLTNTFNLDKIKYYPKFSWPRITNPKVVFPLNDTNRADVQHREDQALSEIHTAIEHHPKDIAALIIEPIQGEGGDNHFRKEFFQTLRKICDDYEIMFIVDEVQTGLGLTGKMWAYEHYGFIPDILCFGKKTQVCGIMVGNNVDEIKDNVFTVSSRLNSTWGGNLVDMVRAQRYLEIIKEERLLDNAAVQGQYLLKGLQRLGEQYGDIINNVRGQGLMCAFDLPSSKLRDDFKNLAYAHGLVILGCGMQSIRFRPPLTITKEDIDEMLSLLDATATQLMVSNKTV